MNYGRLKEEGDKEVFITQQYNEDFNVKIKQNPGEQALKVHLENQLHGLNVSLQPGSRINIKNIEPLEVSIVKTPENTYFFTESKELNFSSKSLLMLGILGVVYGKYNIVVTSFLGISIKDDSINLPGVISLLIFFETIIFLVYFIRDIRKFGADNTAQKNSIERNLSTFKEDKRRNELRLKAETKAEVKTQILKEIEGNIKMIKRFENENEQIKIQRYNKNIVFLGIKTAIPFTLGFFGFYTLGINIFFEKIKDFNFIDVLAIMIPFFLIFFIGKYYLEKYKDVEIKKQVI